MSYNTPPTPGRGLLARTPDPRSGHALTPLTPLSPLELFGGSSGSAEEAEPCEIHFDTEDVIYQHNSILINVPDNEIARGVLSRKRLRFNYNGSQYIVCVLEHNAYPGGACIPINIIKDQSQTKVTVRATLYMANSLQARVNPDRPAGSVFYASIGLSVNPFDLR
jgi:hypothetical protein